LTKAAEELGPRVGLAQACRSLAVARSSVYRARRPAAERKARPKPARALSEKERDEVLSVLNSERYMDQAPAEVYAALLDKGIYYCSVRTMYRILGEADQVRERRNQLTHPEYEKPELLAARPNELWSWDITKLRGPVKWTYYYLYSILDVFSRYTVGWMVAARESAALAKRLINDTCEKQEIVKDQLTVHADRGSAMKSRCVAMLLSDLGVTKTHSRPHVSNDNPYSESQFKTLKYRPAFPKRFGSIQDARAFCVEFFSWYNTQHHHSGIGFMTPETVHYGLAGDVTAARQKALNEAHLRHPERFVRKPPQAPRLPEAVWINPPAAMSLKTRAADGRREWVLDNSSETNGGGGSIGAGTDIEREMLLNFQKELSQSC